MPSVQNTLHAFGDAFAHVEKDGTHYSLPFGHANDSTSNNGINDPDNPQTHPDAYRNYVNTLFSVASQVSIIPRVSNSVIISLVNNVTSADESAQVKVLESRIGSVNPAISSSLVHSPVSDCGSFGCLNKPTGSQVNPEIKNIYGVKK